MTRPDHMWLSQQTAGSKGLEWSSLSVANFLCLGHTSTLEDREVGQANEEDHHTQPSVPESDSTTR